MQSISVKKVGIKKLRLQYAIVANELYVCTCVLLLQASALVRIKHFPPFILNHINRIYRFKVLLLVSKALQLY